MWRARQTTAGDRFVAVKLLLVDEGDSVENAQRLLREIDFARERQHPALVQVFHGGRAEGCVYYVMEYVEGGHLGDFVARTSPDAERCAELIMDVAEGVAHLHSEGVIHRDLKPGNILISREGKPKVADFGLAKLLNDPIPIALTPTRALLGTPAYMAPEQAAGRKAGPPADVWALGVILHEMLTGAHPLDGMKSGGTPASDEYIGLLGDMHRESRSPPPLRVTAPRTHRWLSDIVGKCLEADPAARYRHADELREDLQLFLADEPPRHALPRSFGMEMRIRYRRRRPFWNLAVFAGVLFIAGLVVYAVNSARSATRERTLRLEAEEASRAERRAAIRADLAREEAEIHRHASEALNMLNRSPPEALRLAVDATESSVRRFGVPPTQVQYSLTYAIDAAREERNWRGLDSNCSAMSPDGKWLAVGDRHGRVRIIDLAHGTESQINAHNSEIRAITFSPDGAKLLTAGNDKTLRCWTPQGEPVGPPLPNRATIVSAIAFSPDGKEIIMAEGNRTIVRCDLNGNMISKPFVGHQNVISSIIVTEEVIVSSDAGGVQSTLRFWSKNGEPLCDPVFLEGWTHSIALSADGKTIASGGANKAVRFWTLDGKPFGKPLYGHSADIRSVNFSFDGLHLVSTSTDGSVWIWNLLGHQPAKVLNAHAGEAIFAAFRARMPTLLTVGGDGNCQEWMLQPFQARSSLDDCSFARFKPDGRFVTKSSDGSIRARDRSGNIVGTISQGKPGNRVAFSKDGEWVCAYPMYAPTIILAQLGAPEQVLKFDHPVSTVAVSSEHRKLVVSEENRLSVYDWEGKPIANGTARHQPLLEVNEARKLFAGVSFLGEASLWNFKVECVAKAAPGRVCTSIAFSPDDASWALGFEDGSVSVVSIPERLDYAPDAPVADLSAGERKLSGHEAPVKALAFSPDGQCIASGATDGTIRISATSGHELTPLWHTGAIISSLAFSPDGKVLVSAGEDGIARFWIADWKGWLELGRKRIAAPVKELSPVRASR